MESDEPQYDYSDDPLFGPALYETGWTVRLAQGLTMSRSQLWQHRRGTPKTSKRDIAAEILEVIDRERDACGVRRLELTQLRSLVVAMIEKAK